MSQPVLPDGGKDRERENRRLVLATREGEMAVKIDVVDLGSDASPVLCDHVVREIRRELGHLVVDDKRERQ